MGFLFFALHPPRPRPPALPPLYTSYSSQHNSSHHLSQPPRHTALITAPLITSHSSHHNSSQLHFSHLTHHTTTHHSSTHHSEPSGEAAARGRAAARVSTQSRTQSRLAELLRAWPPPAAGVRVAGAVYRAVWRGCCARGRRWPADDVRVLRLPGGIAARMAAAGPQLAFVWKAQYIEPPGGAAVSLARG